jgi:hypothetical protein
VPQIEVKQSGRLSLTSYSGVALLGQCFDAAQVDLVVDRRLPVSQGMRTSDLVKSTVGLLALGKCDFEAIEPFRQDRFFKEALGLAKVPGSVWMRQRLDAKAAEIRELTDELSLRMLERLEAPISAHQGFVCVDMDTFVMDNSGTRKEHVGRTYQGVDGYTPIAAYLGNEGWNVGLELRSGTHHSALETEYFLERVFPRVRRLMRARAEPVLWRADCGFDSARLLLALQTERERWAAQERSLDFIVKWNPRRQDKAAWVQRADAAQDFEETRKGKRVGYCSEVVERSSGRGSDKLRRSLRLVVEVTERTIDKKGQRLLAPEVELQGWWTPPRTATGGYRQALQEPRHPRAVPLGDQDRLGPGAPALGQVRHQRRGAAPGGVRLQRPAAAGATGFGRQDHAAAPPGQTSAHQDRAAGDHVPRRQSRLACAPPGAGLRPRRGRPCDRVHRAARASGAGLLPVTAPVLQRQTRPGVCAPGGLLRGRVPMP